MPCHDVLYILYLCTAVYSILLAFGLYKVNFCYFILMLHNFQSFNVMLCMFTQVFIVLHNFYGEIAPLDLLLTIFTKKIRGVS